MWKEFGEVFERAGGERGRSLGFEIVLVFFFGFVSQGFAGFDQQCQLEDTFSQEALNLWLQQQRPLKERSVPKGSDFKPAASLLKHVPLGSRPFLCTHTDVKVWTRGFLLWIVRDDFKHFCQNR